VASLIDSSPSPAPTLGERDGRPHHPLVLVRWVDIIADSSWTPPEEVECPEFETVGWLVHEDEKCIKVADTYGEEGHFGITAFPRGCVISTVVVDDRAKKMSPENGGHVGGTN